jgi:hypothetical protein
MGPSLILAGKTFSSPAALRRIAANIAKPPELLRRS